MNAVSNGRLGMSGVKTSKRAIRQTGWRAGRKRLAFAFARRWEVHPVRASSLLGFGLCSSGASPYFLDVWNLSDATFNFTEKAIDRTLPMALLDHRAAKSTSPSPAIMALASDRDGPRRRRQMGVGTCGWTGGRWGIAHGPCLRHRQRHPRHGVPACACRLDRRHHRHDEPVPRHFGYAILGDQVLKSNTPPASRAFGQGYVVWGPISFEFVLFIALAIAFAILLHATNFGRQVFVIGNNEFAARFSGIPVERVKFILFLLTGLMSGVASVCLTSRLGSTRPSIAQGWELEVVTMVVLGGVSILGGAGTIAGVVIAAFVMGLVTFGLGLLNVPGIVMSIFVGLLLIITIAVPIVARRIKEMSR